MIKPLSLSPTARQRALARSLYRKILRECQQIPPEASLVHLDQWVGDTQIKDRDTLRSCLRSGFRRRGSDIPNEKNEGIEGIQRALDGLKCLLTLDLIDLTESQTETKMETADSTKKREDNSYSLHSPICSESLLESVEWLSLASEAKETNPRELLEFPIFPLSGPLFPDENGERLPLLSRFSDTPVLGMDIPLQIFEPRYRKLYQDLLSSTDGSRRFVVPFSHPYRQGTFATFGWIYEIVNVKDVADQSNGKFQLVCNHVVSQPIKIVGIANPEDYDTQSTYLRCFANILPHGEDDNKDTTTTTTTMKQKKEGGPDASLGEKPSNSVDLRPLEELLHQLKNKQLSLSSDNNNRQVDKSLINRLLMASGEGSIWPVAQVWIRNLQTEILRLQMKISTRIQVQAKAAEQMSSSDKEWQDFITEEMVSLAQEPYKSHLRCMLIEVSTLIPWLLQEDSHEAQCHQLCERIRERLLNKTEQQS